MVISVDSGKSESVIKAGFPENEVKVGITVSEATTELSSTLQQSLRIHLSP